MCSKCKIKPRPDSPISFKFISSELEILKLNKLKINKVTLVFINPRLTNHELLAQVPARVRY